MEQRRLRLGDILDDYCPRERRVTNHAVVAMIEEDVKQTRCTTCDAEHVYRGGREPRRRKKDMPGALYREVLADMPEAPITPVAAGAEADAPAYTPSEVADPVTESSETHSAADSVTEDDPAVAVVDVIEEGPVNRPLIRATLPRPEGQKDVRQATDFTVRHNGGRGGQFRGDRSQRAHGVDGSGNGGRPHGRRFSGGHQAGMPGRGSSGRGAGEGFRGANGPQRHGGKKRSR